MAVNYACCGLARVSSSSSDYDCPICINNYMEEQFGRL